MKQTYTVRAERRDDIEKMVARYTRKAQKYGIPLTVTYGDPYAKQIKLLRTDYETQATVEVGNEMVEVMDIVIDGETIQADGYTVIARIEHLDGGNIVNVFNGDIDAEWCKLAPRCEHCGGNHHQKVTFIVEAPDGGRKQVGRTCLKEYSGIDPMGIGAVNQVHDILLDEDFHSGGFWDEPLVKAYDTVEALALAIRINRQYGYVRSDMTNSNKDKLRDMVGHEYPTADEMIEARNIADAVLNMGTEEAVGNLLDKAQTLLKCGYCKPSHFGFIAYAPVAYGRYAERLLKEAERQSAKQNERFSQYVGEVGKRQSFDISTAMLVTSWEGEWGTTWLYKFTDTDGNVLVWFTGTGLDDTDKVKTIKATVKAHNERDGVRQTVLTRVKVV